MRYFSFFILITFFPLLAQAQFPSLPLGQQRIIKQQWAKKTPQVSLKSNGTDYRGQIIYANDSGIVWRTVPQYLPYSYDNVAFIPFDQVEEMKIEQPWRMGQNLGLGAWTGGFLASSLAASFPNNGRRWIWYSNRYYGYRIKNFLRGALVGAVIGGIQAVRKHKSQQLYFQDQENAHLFYLGQIDEAALYPQRKLKKNTLIIRDSMITGVDLPDELDLLQEIPQNQRWQVSVGQGVTDLWGRTSIVPELPSLPGLNREIYSNNYYHYEISSTPSFYEIRAFYRLNPWLKVGVQTHKIDNVANKFTAKNSQFWFDLRGARSLNHGQSWGIVAETTPLPTRFLRLRRWDANFGGGVFHQNATIRHAFDVFSWGNTSEYIASRKYTYQSALAYGGITYHIFPWLNMQMKMGRYYAPTIDEPEFSFDDVPEVDQLIVAPATYRLSWNYYSFSANFSF